nr:hypothetical protein [Tanacetum cinerariifolium]GEX75622.1 hypothetical protein [Tanacetum cinerariifolium]
MLRGRLLASFQDREHEGGDTRSQGGIKDNDLKIKIQDHNKHMISLRNSQEQGFKIQESDGNDKVINDDDERTDSDNNGDDFVHPKFSTHDEEDKDKESFNPIFQTPSQVENIDDEDNDENSHGMNVEGDKGANEEDEAKELYRDVNINLIGRDVQMEDVQTNQLIEDTHVTLTLVNPEDMITLKRHRDDKDKDEEPFAGSNQGSKRRREGKEPELTSAPKGKTSSKSTEGSKSHHKTASESTPVEEPMHTT